MRTASPGRLDADLAFSRAAGAPLVGGNAVRLLADGGENYPAWLRAIADAERFIHFESYIVHDDRTGARACPTCTINSPTCGPPPARRCPPTNALAGTIYRGAETSRYGSRQSPTGCGPASAPRISTCRAGWATGNVVLGLVAVWRPELLGIHWRPRRSGSALPCLAPRGGRPVPRVFRRSHGDIIKGLSRLPVSGLAT